MNIDKIIEIVDVKKKELAKNISLSETKLLSIFAILDLFIGDALMIFFCRVILNYNYNDFVPMLISMSIVSFIAVFLFIVKPIMRSPISYMCLTKIFQLQMQELEKKFKEKHALDKQLDKDFLLQISENMDKSEVEKFLQKYEGKVTLKKFEKEILNNEEIK